MSLRLVEGGRQDRPRTAGGTPLDAPSPQVKAPAGASSPATARPAAARSATAQHPVAKALAVTVGAFALLAGGFALGTARGQDLLRAWVPSVAQAPALPEVREEALEDGYGGELARRVAEASAQLAAGGAAAGDVDDAVSGAVEGLLSAAGDGSATYLTPGQYERFSSAAGSASASRGTSSVGASLSAGVTRMVEGVGVIDVAALTGGALETGSADAVADAVRGLEARGATALVLDLRGVFGSDLGEASRVASLFLDGGTVARVADGSGGGDVLDAQAALHVTDAPLVALVDEGTYGGPEVVAAALQDHQRALVAGRATAGGATVQQVRELSFGGALVLSSALVSTPDGAPIDGRGVAPDLVMAAGGLPSSITATPGDARDSASSVSGPAVSASAQGAQAAGAADALAEGERLATQDAQLAGSVALARLWAQTGSARVVGLTNAPGPQDDAFHDEPAGDAALAALLRSAGLLPPEPVAAAAEATGTGASVAAGVTDPGVPATADSAAPATADSPAPAAAEGPAA